MNFSSLVLLQHRSASGKCAEVLSVYILSQYPTTPEAFSSSLANSLLQQFYTSLFSVQRSLPVEISQQLDEYRKSVLSAPSLLDELGSIIISGELSAVPNSPESPSKKRQPKKTKRKVQRINFDVFKKAEYSVPESQEAAEVLALNVLDELKYILQVSFLLIDPYLHRLVTCNSNILQSYRTPRTHKSSWTPIFSILNLNNRPN